MWVDLPKLGAGGDINPARFIMIDTSRNYSVVQSDATPAAGTLPIIGVTKEDTRETPQGASSDPLHAKAGENVRYHGCSAGEVCLVVAGAAIAAGAWLTSNATGQAVTCTTGQRAYAIALEAAAGANQKVRVLLIPGTSVA